MISVRALINAASAYLVDNEPGYENTTYTEDDLFTYVAWGMAVIANIQKSKFTTTQTFDLTPGMVQVLPPDVELVDLLSVTSDGEETIPRRSNAVFRGKMLRCGTDATRYKMDNWQYDPASPNTFTVKPPVPSEGSHTYMATVFSVPEVKSKDGTIAANMMYTPVLIELVLYYAYGVDTESVPNRDRSASHWANAMTLLGMDSRTPANRYTRSRLPEMRNR